ncbi:Small heat shock protein RTM2-like protein, partial [Aduncisulcus paluster]
TQLLAELRGCVYNELYSAFFPYLKEFVAFENADTLGSLRLKRSDSSSSSSSMDIQSTQEIVPSPSSLCLFKDLFPSASIYGFSLLASLLDCVEDVVEASHGNPRYEREKIVEKVLSILSQCPTLPSMTPMPQPRTKTHTPIHSVWCCGLDLCLCEGVCIHGMSMEAIFCDPFLPFLSLCSLAVCIRMYECMCEFSKLSVDLKRAKESKAKNAPSRVKNTREHIKTVMSELELLQSALLAGKISCVNVCLCRGWLCNRVKEIVELRNKANHAILSEEKEEELESGKESASPFKFIDNDELQRRKKKMEEEKLKEQKKKEYEKRAREKKSTEAKKIDTGKRRVSSQKKRAPIKKTKSGFKQSMW